MAIRKRQKAITKVTKRDMLISISVQNLCTPVSLQSESFDKSADETTHSSKSAECCWEIFDMSNDKTVLFQYRKNCCWCKLESCLSFPN